MEEYEKRYRPVKKTLSIPGRLNDAAESAHINFSGVLQDPYLCFSSFKALTKWCNCGVVSHAKRKILIYHRYYFVFSKILP